MGKKYRYEWIGRPYNDEDLHKGQRFYVLDTITGIKYEYPMFEERIDKNGNIYRQRLVNENLWNQEFMNFGCSTSSDFSRYIPDEFMTPELCLIALQNTSSDEFLSKIPENILTHEMCSVFVSRFPLALFSVPKNMITKQMVETAVNIDGRSIIYAPLELITQEIFSKALDTYHKSWGDLFDKQERKEYLVKLINQEIAEKLIKISDVYLRYIPQEFMTEEMANKVISKNIRFMAYLPERLITKSMCIDAVNDKGILLKFVPKKFIDLELCKMAINNDPNSIEFVPKEFQTLELQKLAISLNGKAISRIPSEYVSKELIEMAIRQNPLSLSKIPDIYKTPEICQLAVSLNAMALVSVPNQLKTYDMCKMAVLYDPRSIRRVPVEILTQEFYDDVIQNGAIIPIKNMSYVRECIEINRKLEEENPIKTNKSANVPSATLDYSNYIDKSLKSISWFFSQTGLKHLEKYGITNLGKLFEFVDNPNFATLFSTSVVYREVKGTVKILKCKFLDEDPLIDESDEEISIEDLSSMFGFTNRTANALSEAKINAKELFEIMRSETPQLELENIRYLGNSGVREIMEKVKIVMDYHDKHKDQDESLEQLNAELQRLREEKRKIDEQTNIVLAKIQEKLISQSKGGVLK